MRTLTLLLTALLIPRVVAPAAAVAPVTVDAAPSAGAAPSATSRVQEWGLELGARELPEGMPEAVAAVLQEEASTLLDGEAPVLRLWLVESLPAATGRAPTGALNYPSIPVGTLMGVMQVEADHIDYRDQTVPPGTYTVRYLQQPVDGAHVGVTFFRDFLALMPLTARTAPEPVSFQTGLARALQLNPHPFVWALWPADEVYPPQEPADEPFLAEIEPGKWAMRTTLPRTEGEPLTIAVVLVGSEPPEGYY